MLTKQKVGGMSFVSLTHSLTLKLSRHFPKFKKTLVGLFLLQLFLLFPSEVFADTTVGTNITTTGNVGIGKTSPTSRLHLDGTSTNYGFVTVGSSDPGTSFPAFDITRAITTALGDNAHGYVDDSWLQFPSNGYAYAAFDNHLNVYGTASYDHLNSFQARPIYNSTGTISKLVASTLSQPYTLEQPQS